MDKEKHRGKKEQVQISPLQKRYWNATEIAIAIVLKIMLTFGLEGSGGEVFLFTWILWQLLSQKTNSQKHHKNAIKFVAKQNITWFQGIAK